MMASILDHKHFRDTQENLTALHDEWMHSSTGTSNTTQGIYEGPTISGPSGTFIGTGPGGPVIHGQQPSISGPPGTFMGTGPGGPLPTQKTMFLPPSDSQFLGHAPSDIEAFINGTLLSTRGGPTIGGGSGDILPMGQTSGGGGSGNCPPGYCDKGGGHCGNGCACCNTNEEVNLCMQGMCGTNCSNCQQSSPNAKGGGGGGKGGKGKVHKGHSKSKHHDKGGGKAQGANALGKLPQLGNVPYTSTPTSGTSPIMIILLLGGAGLLIYFIWHKLRKSKAEDKEMSAKGE